MRFLGLELEDRVPDARTIWLFREKLTTAGAIKRGGIYLIDRGAGAVGKAFLIALARFLSATKLVLSQEIRSQLQAYYLDDIRLTGFNLEHWRQSALG